MNSDEILFSSRRAAFGVSRLDRPARELDGADRAEKLLFFAHDILSVLGVEDVTGRRRALLGLPAGTHLLQRKAGPYLTVEGVRALLAKKSGRHAAQLERYIEEISLQYGRDDRPE